MRMYIQYPETFKDGRRFDGRGFSTFLIFRVFSDQNHKLGETAMNFIRIKYIFIDIIKNLKID